MGKKRGKAAKKRRREESEVDVSSLASKLIQLDNASKGKDDDNDDDSTETNAQHGISDASLETTVATLQKICGLVDTVTGKLALKDKRYRNLRKVVYELQSSLGGGGGGVQTSNNTQSFKDFCNNNGKSTNTATTTTISLSKITCEISAQIENGCWELAINTLRNVRKKQEEYYATAKKQANSVEGRTNTTDANYLRPKLGSVQRWVRQIDAAGTNDPFAIGVLDAILRLVVPPDALLPMDKIDIDRAIWTRLGVNSSSSDNEKGRKHDKSGSVRLFPPVDRRLNHEEITMMPQKIGSQDEFPLLDNLVRSMEVGEEDGIRITPAVDDAVHTPRDMLFRQCGFEKGEARRPPNKYDLELVTSADIYETKSLDSGDPPNTVEGHHILQEDHEPCSPIIKTLLPYVQDSFLLENILSMKECDRLIAAAESAGTQPGRGRPRRSDQIAGFA